MHLPRDAVFSRPGLTGQQRHAEVRRDASDLEAEPFDGRTCAGQDVVGIGWRSVFVGECRHGPEWSIGRRVRQITGGISTNVKRRMLWASAWGLCNKEAQLLRF